MKESYSDRQDNGEHAMNEIKCIKSTIHSIQHYSCLPELRKRHTVSRKNSLITREIDKGVYSLVDRGIVQAGEDATSLVQLGSRSLKLPNLRFTKGKFMC